MLCLTHIRNRWACLVAIRGLKLGTVLENYMLMSFFALSLLDFFGGGGCIS